MRSPVEATTYRDPDSKQHLYAVKTKLVEQTYHGNPHRAKRIRERYGDIPIMITENGLGDKDPIGDNGDILDYPRIEYLREHIRWCKRAIEDGVNLIGYFAWSFIDLLSWLNGYQKQYGFVYVDHEKGLKRIKKQSYFWYQKLIETNGEEL